MGFDQEIGKRFALRGQQRDVGGQIKRNWIGLIAEKFNAATETEVMCETLAFFPSNPFADQPAKRVLVQAIKTGKAPLVLLPSLVMHARDDSKHAPEAEAILRGEASLDWT